MHRELDALGADEAHEHGASLLDVREPDEFAAGHAPGAVSIPLGSLQARRTELPAEGVILCICRSGVRSATAADLLVAAGHDAVNVLGGTLAWSREGLALVASDGGSGTVE